MIQGLRKKVKLKGNIDIAGCLRTKSQALDNMQHCTFLMIIFCFSALISMLSTESWALVLVYNIRFVNIDMSISESQYYEAKVFIKSLIEAHRALDEATKEQAKVDKLKFYESALVDSARRGQIKISGDTVTKGQGFESSKINSISIFVGSYLATRLGNFNSAINASDVATALKNGSL